METHSPEARFYNESYKQQNYFRYSTWLYAAYISKLVEFCGLRDGDSLLDVGCGQGMFSYLFRKHNLEVRGIDISETGVRTAVNLYGKFGVAFAVEDIYTATYRKPFDCVFVRSCSLYNTDAFPLRRDITQNLLRLLKEGGTLIFMYNSNFSSKKSPTWRYHSLGDVKEHFSNWPEVQMFFMNKFTSFLVRKYSFSKSITRLNVLLSSALGIGGEIVCVLKKPLSR